MQNVLQLILRFGSFITFILLEIIALYLIVNYNESQQSIFLNSTKVYRGEFTEKINNYDRYFSLERVNDSLANQNASLLAEGFNRKSPIELDTSIKYDVIAANIVGNSFNLRNNHITIDKGIVDGVVADMGVIGSKGLLGIVSNVTEQYALVNSLLHSQSRISCTVRPHQYPGNLIWKSDNPRYMTLEAIPKHIIISKGDTVVTNGFSTLFPKDIVVGFVEDYKIDSGSNNYRIKVRLINDIPGSKIAYVIKNIDAEEIAELKVDVINE